MITALIGGSSAALAGLFGLTVMTPGEGLIVETPDLGGFTQVTAGNDDALTGTWYSPVRPGTISIGFGEGWKGHLLGDDSVPEEYLDRAQAFSYRGDCNARGSAAYLDDQDHLQFSEAFWTTDVYCGDGPFPDKVALESVLFAEETTLHLERDSDLWLVAGDHAIEFQRELPEAQEPAATLSSLSSR